MPGMSPLLLSLLALAAGTPAGSKPAPIVQPPATLRVRDPAPVTIATAQDVAALCKALTPAERMRFQGDAVSRGQAEAEHDATRDAALAARYRVEVATAQLGFEPYDPEEKRLALSVKTTLPAVGGRLRLWPGEGLAVEVDAATARQILEGQKQRTLRLEVTFEAASDDGGTPCTSVSGEKTSTLSVDAVTWEYTVGERLVARGGEGADRPLVTAAQGARRRVEVAPAISDANGREVRKRVQGRAGDLEGCYAGALTKDPALDGSLVAELKLTAGGGAPERVAIVADSIQDDAMAACVKKVLGRTEFPSGKAQQVTVPIHFLLEAPEGATGAAR
jgi:hypothetical protein